MKQGLLFSLSTIIFLAPALPIMALPLQEGMYRIGSKYIQIAAKGDRVCYEGMSARGGLTSSVAPHPTLPDFFLVNFLTQEGKEPLVLHQPSVGQLLYGTVHQLSNWDADYQIPRDKSDRMKRCLESTKPFREDVKSSR